MTGKRYRLVLYDTSDFEGFPIGGQLTSIRNFLRYVALGHGVPAEEILLVGVTTDPEGPGRLRQIDLGGKRFDFFPVLSRNRDLSGAEGSLRAAYLKGLCRYHRQLPGGKQVIHYLHTPEAFLYLTAFRPFCRTAVFSHGSFFNLAAGFRFYRSCPLVGPLCGGFVRFLLRRADLIFTLDRISTEQYRPYSRNVVQVENSVVLPEPREKQAHDPLRLLYAGRLSGVKQVDGILRAMPDRVRLTVAGDGEERDALLALTAELRLEDRVTFLGAVDPAQMDRLLEEHDILVMNSALEGKPMAIIEALAHGLPVIAPPVGGIPEMLCSGSDSVLTGAEGLPEAVEQIAGDYDAFSRRARQAAGRYDYRRVNGQILSALQKLAEGSGPAAFLPEEEA